jgi:Na+-transporting NADH:ubiquinone oxidoreductase subunit NqrB
MGSSWRKHLLNPSALASVAVLLLAIAFEVDLDWLRHVLDGLAGLAAITGLCYSRGQSVPP